MLALTITTMIAGAIAAMMATVSAGVTTRRDSRGIMVRAHAAVSRLSAYVVPARCALDQNREVFVLPGPCSDWRFTGGNQLIQQGAKLVNDLSDILDELPQKIASRSFE